MQRQILVHTQTGSGHFHSFALRNGNKSHWQDVSYSETYPKRLAAVIDVKELTTFPCPHIITAVGATRSE
ncbi:hypothetical protein CHARACLAT_004047 [Characodon lateralis]|uniref:Uncharacterized protein n=1 Tax=Characodon lateralis TaxID=208331 RepID=A0ABU7CY23_9TELE|nr:hypothetical protein [Characodon lateralis]